jgi:competence protein ComFC
MIPIDWIVHGLAALGDLLLPPTCAVCGCLLDSSGTVVCPECFCGFEPLSGPGCSRCGQPYPGAGPCPDCRDEEGHLEKIRSVYAYGGPLQEAVLRLKLDKKTLLAPFFADRIARADLDGVDLRNQDFLVPVPLHKNRQAGRGFNQSQLIARRLSRLLDVPLASFHLHRTRPTPSQFQMATRKQRRENVKNAFAVGSRHPFDGKKLCLVDDVVTTGATLQECARALASAGAGRIVAVTLARTVRW